MSLVLELWLDFRGYSEDFLFFEPSVKGLLVPVPVAAEIFLISTARKYWFGVMEHKQDLRGMELKFS